ncbi:Mu transposase C-terminal domain-containing protein [Lichenibacterium ramalinae]|uniref:Integrase catalytic domain-containing protein n=1 Tax=Lichenibacterium ramalinae TaxID=2316527 RepID=A0A4V1RI30_9HYPH|nr:Mu transposase C-terminal domain-containing protein [Lichenibacterium ramalinae]RYB02117.1 hypothetical protein D3272_22615 [Lichenibacterium ramalinae]
MKAALATRSLPHEAAAPTILLPKGIIVEVGALAERTLRRLSVVKRWPRHDGVASRVQFEDDLGRPTTLTDEQIALLCRQGRFRVVFDAEGRAVTPRPTLLDLSAEQLALCRWRRAFVDAFYAEPHPASRSRPDVGAKIARTFEKVGGTKAPCYQSVLNWVDVWEEQGELFPLECLHFAPNTGNRDWKVSSELVDEMVDIGVKNALGLAKGTGEDARGFAAAALKVRLEELGRSDLLGHEKLALALLGTKLDEEPTLAEVTMPTLRTFQRRMKEVDAFLRDDSRFGERRGRRKHARSYERPLPELPLSEVECDHTPCDVIVVDDVRKVIFGRPDLIAFRDRATGAFLGVSIGFEAPSFASFVNGLRHAMYPKDMSEYPSLRPWPMFGRPTRLYVDKALHFVGNNIERTSAALGFEIREFLPAEPSLKGGTERLIGVINAAMHKLPAATFSNAEERKRYADLAGKPTVTIDRLRAFVTSWITDKHNPGQHEGLGFMKRLKGIPEVLWDEKIGQVEMAPLPREETFVWLAGDSKRCHVTEDGGIYWDHIQYQSIALAAITGKAGHKSGRDKKEWQGREHEGSKYLVRRDPFDIGHVYVTNPFDGGRVIKVGATRMDYAGGLTLHQHNVIKANADADLRRAADRDPVDVLMRARKEVDRYVELLFQQRRQDGHDKRLARWLEHGRRREEASTVSRPAFSPALSAAFVDPTAPAGIDPPPPGSIDTVAATAAGPAAAGTERDTFDTSQPLPERVDRGAKVAARIEARRLAAEAEAEAERRPQPDADPLTTEDMEAIRDRRGWGTLDMGAFRSSPNPKVTSDAAKPSAGETRTKPVGEAAPTPPTATRPVPPPGPRDETDVFSRLRAAQRHRSVHPAPANEPAKPEPGPGDPEPETKDQ